MFEMVIEYDRYECKQRWIKIVPKNQWSELCFCKVCFLGDDIRVRQSNTPEDNSGMAFIFGQAEEYTFNWYNSCGTGGQIRHLGALWLWAKQFGYKLKFIDSTGLFEDITEQPVFKCPTCGRWHLISEFCFIESRHIIYCVDCKGSIKTCERCGYFYTSDFCTHCYTEEPCCICGCNDDTFLRSFNGDSIPVCNKHKDTRLIMEASYNWKPESYTFRHMGKERGNK